MNPYEIRTVNKNITEDAGKMKEDEMDKEMSDALAFRSDNEGQFMGNTNQMWHGDLLARYFGCTLVDVDVDKSWGEENELNRFSGVSYVRFSREYPEKKILLDLFVAELDGDIDAAKARIQKIIDERRVLCAKHGYMYVGGIDGDKLSYPDVERQLKESKDLIDPPKEEMATEEVKKEADETPHYSGKKKGGADAKK